MCSEQDNSGLRLVLPYEVVQGQASSSHQGSRPVSDCLTESQQISGVYLFTGSRERRQREKSEEKIDSRRQDHACMSERVCVCEWMYSQNCPVPNCCPDRRGFVCFFYLNLFKAQAILPSHQRKKPPVPTKNE